MKRYGLLILAILFNALGTALMVLSNLGMTVWGGTAFGTSVLFEVSIGMGFVIIAVLFYAVAIIVRKSFRWQEALISFLLLYSFGVLSDLFILILPQQDWSVGMRILLNLMGLSILNLGISIHLKINLAVFPLDVYTGVMQQAFRSIPKGTYFAYGSAFVVFLVLSYFNGGLLGMGIGTVFTLALSGYHMDIYDKFITGKIRV